VEPDAEQVQVAGLHQRGALLGVQLQLGLQVGHPAQQPHLTRLEMVSC